MSQGDEREQAMPDPAAVRAACERLQQKIDSQANDAYTKLWPSALVSVADLHLLLAALSARDEARDALQSLEALVRGGTVTIDSNEQGWIEVFWEERLSVSVDGEVCEIHEYASQTLPLAIQALAAQLPSMSGKQDGEGVVSEGEMKEAGEG